MTAMTAMTTERVTFARDGRLVLDDISIRVQPGELVALIGANGAGKSTLMRVLTGELRPHAGRCTLDHLDVHHTAADTLARHRAVLPQDVSTDFPLRVDEIIALGRTPWRRHATPQRNRQALAEATETVSVTALLARNYCRLSGGERQRVQLARVLAQIWDVHWDHTPRYLLLDEPTASLDIGHQQRLLTTIRRMLPKGIGVVAVLHDLNLAAAFADRIYLLHDGRILTEGIPAAVLNAPALNTAYAAELDVRLDAPGSRPVVLPCSGH